MVVFLSLVGGHSVHQATGRVVRQGSFHQWVRVVVLGVAQSAETEDERFRTIVHDISKGKIHESV